MVMVMKLIDVSEHNGRIDFEKVKNSGYTAVIIRAGYGKGNVDGRFTENIQKAIKAGMKIGIYWFSYAYTDEMAKREAQYCNDVLDPYKKYISLPVFFDWEYDSMSYAKKKGVYPNKYSITNMVRAFCKRVKALGFDAGYYANLDYQNNYLDTNLLKEYKKWFAWYTSTPQKNCYIWQYTDKGSVSGISGTVDLNDWYESNESTNESEDYDMPQLQKGSQGKAVAVWQIIVSAIPDGTFGAETIEATKIFQREHGLLVDGIVGPKTWKEGLASL
jgi:GH25 family lysozyme M1 (1,4-beta-N-acetylmuramidase)